MMDGNFHLNMFPSRQSIIDIAFHLQTQPGFIEKDWYVTRVIHKISEIHSNKFIPIFCGGTSLLKGHNIIRRFSEDVDFRILNLGDQINTRKQRRDFRNILLAHIDSVGDMRILNDTIVSRDNSRFFSVNISYPRIFDTVTSLRPEVKLECTFVEHTIDNYDKKGIRSMASKFTNEGNIVQIPCLSLLETCTDKVSAFIWRVLSRKREVVGDDKTIIRHLYDLHELAKAQIDSERLNNEARRVFNLDKKRGRISDSFYDAFKRVIIILDRDKKYEQEYNDYVLSMCFGIDNRPTYHEAIESFVNLIK